MFYLFIYRYIKYFIISMIYPGIPRSQLDKTKL